MRVKHTPRPAVEVRQTRLGNSDRRRLEKRLSQLEVQLKVGAAAALGKTTPVWGPFPFQRSSSGLSDRHPSPSQAGLPISLASGSMSTNQGGSTFKGSNATGECLARHRLVVAGHYRLHTSRYRPSVYAVLCTASRQILQIDCWVTDGLHVLDLCPIWIPDAGNLHSSSPELLGHCVSGFPSTSAGTIHRTVRTARTADRFSMTGQLSLFSLLPILPPRRPKLHLAAPSTPASTRNWPAPSSTASTSSNPSRFWTITKPPIGLPFLSVTEARENIAHCTSQAPQHRSRSTAAATARPATCHSPLPTSHPKHRPRIVIVPSSLASRSSLVARCPSPIICRPSARALHMHCCTLSATALCLDCSHCSQTGVEKPHAVSLPCSPSDTIPSLLWVGSAIGPGRADSFPAAADSVALQHRLLRRHLHFYGTLAVPCFFVRLQPYVHSSHHHLPPHTRAAFQVLPRLMSS
ncbi:hypothetical protein B0T17DRAFT_76812 [Bombardia bombarda]|uniref:Uncharacterized protein n=1 Tax=Bombardia bombarda TaxID=252184 RepID=A0AA39XN39_9PEZI|nr:hypothetical protein B0T17DRAFT_76812 [Bombardia bombarda]